MANPFKYLGKTISEALGYGIGGAMEAAIEPLVRDVVNLAWSEHPVNPLSPDQAADLVAEGIWGRDHGAGVASHTGINGENFDAMVLSSENAPDLGTLLELRRRGLIDDARLAYGIRKGLIHPDWIAGLDKLTVTLLSPAELANARQQGFVDEARQKGEAQLQGVDPERAEIQFDLAGLPPGVAEALTMLNRGIIAEDTFRQIVREGHTKVKYTDELLKLRQTILGIPAAVEGVLRERIPRSKGVEIAAMHGLSADDFDLLVNFSGRPPGITQATTLVNRGVMTDADFREVVARSNVRTEYADDLLELRRHYPNLFQLRSMVSSGALDDATALDWLHKQGYIEPVGSKILATFKAGRTSKERDLVKGEVETLYEGRYMTEAEARTLLAGMGYASDEVQALLELADARRIRKYLDANVTKLHNQYVAHRIDAGTAGAGLDQLGISAQARQDLLTLWSHEQAANVQPLTEGQILTALHHAVIGSATAYDRLLALGVGDQDARILVSVQTGKFGGPGELTAALP